MAQLNLIQTNFTTGAISPALYGRVDVSKYANGAEVIENMLVRPQGGVFRRPGTKFVGLSAALDSDPTQKVRIFPFSFNAEQSYLMEVFDLSVRIWKDDVEHSIISAPWASADIPDLRYCQSADVLWVFHPKYPVYTISRTLGEVFTCEVYEFEDGPYEANFQRHDAYVTDYSHTATLRVHSGTMTFVLGDLTKYIEYKQDGVWKLGQIATIVSTTECTITVLDNLLTDLDASSRVDFKRKGSPSITDIGRDPSTYRAANQEYHSTYAAGNVTSTGANFRRSDRGKYIRDTDGANEGTWAIINAFTSATSCTATALTMKTYTYPTDTVVIVDEVRTCKVAVKTGGDDDLGTNFWRIASPLTGDTGGAADTAVEGRHIRLYFSGLVCWGKISQITSGNSKSVDVVLETNLPRDFNDGRVIALDGVPTKWKLGALCGEISGDDFYGTGYPSCGVFHEQRLTMASTYTESQAVWMSRPNDYGNMSPTELDSTVADDNAISYTLVSRQVNKILWLESGPVLLIGTVGGEWQVKAASNIAAPLTPSNIATTPQGTQGSSTTIEGTRIGAAVLFVNKTGKRCNHLQYNYELDQFVAKDITVLSEHILREDGAYAVRAAYQQDPYSVYWVVLSNGRLAALTYAPDQEVYAWTSHSLGGSGDDDTYTNVKDVCVIGSPDGSQDYVYFLTTRVVDGVLTHVIERLHEYFDPENVDEELGQLFYDLSQVYNGASTSTLPDTNLLFQVSNSNTRVLGNGVDLGQHSSAGGVITLTAPVTKAVYGFQQDFVGIRTIRPEVPTTLGSSQSRTKRIDKVGVRIRASRDFYIGDGSTMTLHKTGKETGLEADVTSLISGDEVINLDQGWGRGGQITIEQRQGYNLEITSIMPRATVTE